MKPNKSAPARAPYETNSENNNTGLFTECQDTSEECKKLKALSSAVTTLENLKPAFREVLAAGPDHPKFNHVQSELRNLDHLLRTLPVLCDRDGRPVHPDNLKKKGCRRG